MSDLNQTERDIGNLTARVAELTRHMRDLDSSYSQGNTHASAYRDEKRNLERQLKATSTEISRMGVTATQSVSGLNNMGMRMLMVGQFADDMQYGLRGVVNNIPQMVMAFGGGAGLAGAMSVLAIGLNQVIDKWGQLDRLWSSNSVETQVDRMRRLAESTSRTLQETTELARFQRQDEVGKQLGGPSDKEQTSIAAVVDRIRNSQGGQADLVEKLTQRRIAEFGAKSFMTKEMDDALAYYRKTGQHDKLAQYEAAALQEATQRARDFFTKMIAALANDPTRRGELEKLIHKVNPDLARTLAEGDVPANANRRAAAVREREAVLRPRQPGMLGDIENVIEGQQQAAKEARDEVRQRNLRLDNWRAQVEQENMNAFGGDAMVAAAGNNMLGLANDPRFRRRFGAQSRADAMAAAAEVTRNQMQQQLMRGGMGRQQAFDVAFEATSQAADVATQIAKQQGLELPQSNKELRAALDMNTRVQREMINKGIPVVWSK